MKKEYIDYILKLRKKWGIPLNGFETLDASMKWESELFNTNKNNLFNNDFGKIFKDFKISAYYEACIHEHLILGTTVLTLTAQKENLKISLKPDARNNKKIRIFIEVFADTTMKDIKDNWDFIGELKKSTIAYKFDCDKRRRTNVHWERDSEIYRLSQEGMKHKEIREIIKNKPTCKNINTCDISKIITKAKKKIKAS
ncbi:hypothetical protein HN569_00615 [bacterium]|nr:hypothetical protein [bacterium]